VALETFGNCRRCPPSPQPDASAVGGEPRADISPDATADFNLKVIHISTGE
jgi:hypothetical protein